jgi:hypothetical protein
MTPRQRVGGNRHTAPIAQEPEVRKGKDATTWIREGGKEPGKESQTALDITVLCRPPPVVLFFCHVGLWPDMDFEMASALCAEAATGPLAGHGL